GTLAEELASINLTEVTPFIHELRDRNDRPAFYDLLASVERIQKQCTSAVEGEQSMAEKVPKTAQSYWGQASTELDRVVKELAELNDQASNRAQALSDKKKELTNLRGAAELARSWNTIEAHVRCA